MYSPVLLWSKELSVFKGHIWLWFGFIPARTGVQLSNADVFEGRDRGEAKVGFRHHNTLGTIWEHNHLLML